MKLGVFLDKRLFFDFDDQGNFLSVLVGAFLTIVVRGAFFHDAFFRYGLFKIKVNFLRLESIIFRDLGSAHFSSVQLFQF